MRIVVVAVLNRYNSCFLVPTSRVYDTAYNEYYVSSFHVYFMRLYQLGACSSMTTSEINKRSLETSTRKVPQNLVILYDKYLHWNSLLADFDGNSFRTPFSKLYFLQTNHILHQWNSCPNPFIVQWRVCLFSETNYFDHYRYYILFIFIMVFLFILVHITFGYLIIFLPGNLKRSRAHKNKTRSSVHYIVNSGI